MGGDLGVQRVDGWRLFIHSQNETSARLIPAIQVGHARELVKREALGLELAPLGYYLKDDELADHVDIDRDPDGGRRTGDVDGEIGSLTISDPPTQAEVQALRAECEELVDDGMALSALVHAARGALVAVEVVKGSA